jgi:hypothetical protein
VLIPFHSNAQILHTENFAVILDTTKNFKGSVIPDFKFQNLKENLLEFENTANISFRIKNSAFTIANKIELSKYGKETLLSGGFLYLEYRRIFRSKYVAEPFIQLHWTEARGLDYKFAGGLNFRYRIISSDNKGLFFGIGPFYEFERWNYNGVKDALLPDDLTAIEKENIKLGTYLSFKWFTDHKFDFDMSIYYQSRVDELFSSPRLASSSSVTYNFTKNIGLILRYQNIYDYKPVVPINKLYNQITFTIEVAF